MLTLTLRQQGSEDFCKFTSLFLYLTCPAVWHIHSLPNKHNVSSAHTLAHIALHPPSRPSFDRHMTLTFPLVCYFLEPPALWDCHYLNRQMNVCVDDNGHIIETSALMVDGGGPCDIWHRRHVSESGNPTLLLFGFLSWFHVWLKRQITQFGCGRVAWLVVH